MNALTCSLLAALAAGSGEADKVPDIRSLDELRQLSAAAVQDEWDIRLGLADAGDDAGPWKLLFCHAKYIGPKDGLRRLRPPDGPRGDARILGPVSYTVERVEPRPAAAERMLRKFAAAALGDTDAERLYAAAIPAASKGTWRITVRGRDGKPIQSREFTVEGDRPCPWRAFACRDGSQPRDSEPAKWEVECVCRPVMPQYPETEPIWRLRAGEQFQAMRSLPGKVGFLPGRLPPWPQYEARYYDGKLRAVKIGEYPYPLALSLDGNGFVIRSESAMIDQPDELLLARWWVDGKPIVAQPAEEEAVPAREVARLVRHTREVRVRFALPEGLGEIKPGTKLTLQAMYCEGGYEPLARGGLARLRAMLSRWPAPQPLLSNRLTFAVTERMLRRSVSAKRGVVDNPLG